MRHRPLPVPGNQVACISTDPARSQVQTLLLNAISADPSSPKRFVAGRVQCIVRAFSRLSDQHNFKPVIAHLMTPECSRLVANSIGAGLPYGSIAQKARERSMALAWARLVASWAVV